MKRNKILRLSQLAMLTALSVMLVVFVQFPIIPSAPFLRYDMADVPILIGTIIFGLPAGFSILFVVSFFQAFLLGGDGFIGMMMHFVATGAMILVVGEACKKDKSVKRLIISMVLASVAMAAVMVPMNYMITSKFYGMPKGAVASLILPAILPFNLIKAGINGALTIIILKIINPFLQRSKHIIGINK